MAYFYKCTIEILNAAVIQFYVTQGRKFIRKIRNIVSFLFI